MQRFDPVQVRVFGDHAEGEAYTLGMVSLLMVLEACPDKHLATIYALQTMNDYFFPYRRERLGSAPDCDRLRNVDSRSQELQTWATPLVCCCARAEEVVMETSNVTSISPRLRYSGSAAAGVSPLGKADPADLAGIDIFRPLTPEQRRTVSDLGHEFLLPGDYVLGVHGSVGETLYSLLEGSAELSVPTSKGYLGVRTVRGGESVPLSILFGEGKLITTAVTVGAVRSFAIPRSFLLRLCVTRPDIGVQVYRTAAEVFGTRYAATLLKLIEAMDGAAPDAHLWTGA